MESELTLMSLIEGDPRKFLGNASYEKFQGFLIGWDIATPERSYFDSRAFHRWVDAKYGLPDKYGASNISLIAGNDHDAFHLFFKELEEFRAVHPEYFTPAQNLETVKNKLLHSRREILEKIFRKPGLYMGCKSVTRLRGFLDGDAYARRQSDPGIQLYADLDPLEEWLKGYHDSNIHLRCEALALLYSSHNEAQAFDWLVERIQEFETEREAGKCGRWGDSFRNQNSEPETSP